MRKSHSPSKLEKNFLFRHVHNHCAGHAVGSGFSANRSYVVFAEHIVNVARDIQFGEFAHDFAVFHKVRHLYGRGEMSVGRGVAAGSHNHVHRLFGNERTQTFRRRLYVKTVKPEARNSVVSGGGSAEIWYVKVSRRFFGR